MRVILGVLRRSLAGRGGWQVSWLEMGRSGSRLAAASYLRDVAASSVSVCLSVCLLPWLPCQWSVASDVLIYNISDFSWKTKQNPPWSGGVSQPGICISVHSPLCSPALLEGLLQLLLEQGNGAVCQCADVPAKLSPCRVLVPGRCQSRGLRAQAGRAA